MHKTLNSYIKVPNLVKGVLNRRGQLTGASRQNPYCINMAYKEKASLR
jgi:hypothetical protein